METESASTSDLPKMKCKLNLLTRPDGSVILSHGDTAVIVGCYGPTEAKPQKMQIDRSSVEVHFRPKAGMPNVSDRFHESIIKNICETALVGTLYPRSAVVVVVQELQNFGGFMSCAINGVCLALLHSGIDMRFLVAAVSCTLLTNGELRLESGSTQMENAKAVFVLVFDSIEGKIVASHTTGTFTVDQFKEALRLCKEASADVFDYYKSVMKNQCLKHVTS